MLIKSNLKISDYNFLYYANRFLGDHYTMKRYGRTRVTFETLCVSLLLATT